MTGTDQMPPDSDLVAQPAIALPDSAAAPRRRSPFWLIVGGAVSAVVGYGLAQVVPDGWPIGESATQIAELQAAQAAQDTSAQALAADVARLSGAVAEAGDQAAVEGLANRIAGVESGLAALQLAQDQAFAGRDQALAALSAKVAAVERQPAADGGVSAAALASYDTEIKELRSMVEAQRGQSSSAGADLAALLAQTQADVKSAADKARTLQQQFELSAVRTTGRAAIMQIEAAMVAGGPFDAALDELAAGGIAVPDGLRAISAGVPSLADLQAGFAAPSRAALGAALKSTVGDSALARVSAFLRNQVGARSLTAQEGADPDAILSRAEAALAKGDLPAVLAEIETLPEAGRAEMVPWVASAQIRIDAIAQVSALADGLGK